MFALSTLPFGEWKSTGLERVVNDVGVGFGIIGWVGMIGRVCCWPVRMMEFDCLGTGRCAMAQLLTFEALANTAAGSVTLFNTAGPFLDDIGGSLSRFQ